MTAIIRNGGYQLENVSVKIVPKKDGQEISYKVAPEEVMTHAGIPVFGLYPDYVNTVEVAYTRTDAKGEKKDIKESYQIYAPPVYSEVNGSPSLKSGMFDTTVVKVDPKFKDRLYLLNNLLTAPSKGAVSSGTIRQAAQLNGLSIRRTQSSILRVPFAGISWPTRSMTWKIPTKQAS